jgi:hypothetical protein
MQRLTAVLVTVLLVILGLAGTGQAQSGIQVQGTIQSVDCQSGTIVLNGPEGSNTVYVSDNTVVVVNSANIAFCSLASYLGQPAIAYLVASGNQFVATQISVTGSATVQPSAPVAPVDAGNTYDETSGAYAPLPIDGTVLGIVVVAGLNYLLVQGPDGQYYRYPYYGSYYSYYYEPYYQAYYGPYYPYLAPVITVPEAILGIVLGTVFVGGLLYLLTNYNGHYWRYPYYGPYYHYYYRAGYHPYRGPSIGYASAPVRQGDPHWTPARGAAGGAAAGAGQNRYLPQPNGGRPSGSGFPRYTPPSNNQSPVRPSPSSAPRYTLPPNLPSNSTWPTRPSPNSAPRYTPPSQYSAPRYTPPSQYSAPRYTPGPQYSPNQQYGPSQRYLPPQSRPGSYGPSSAPRYSAPSYRAPSYRAPTYRQNCSNQSCH